MLIEKVGELVSPETSLKRFLVQDNEDEGTKSVDDFEQTLKGIKWQLIKDKLVKEYEIKVEHSDMINTARDLTKVQFAQYGIMTVSSEVLEHYAERNLKEDEDAMNIVDRVLDMKLADKLKEKIKLNQKTVSYDEFIQLPK
jgi:trigger factor